MKFRWLLSTTAAVFIRLKRTARNENKGGVFYVRIKTVIHRNQGKAIYLGLGYLKIKKTIQRILKIEIFWGLSIFSQLFRRVPIGIEQVSF